MLRSKLPDLGITIFTRMTQLAQETGAINLSQGFPDFAPPAALLEAAARHLRDGQNQYAPMIGIAPLREQVARQIARRHGRQLDSQHEVTIVPGATEALFCAIQALVQPGDEVILLDPSYDSYAPAVHLAGGRCVHVPLQQPDFSIDWQRLQEAFSPRTRLLVINSPHNPSGALITRADLDRLAALLRDTHALLLSDEVYEHLIYDGAQHASVLAHDELYPRALVVSSFGKTYHVTGWKTGYVAAPPTLTAELRKVHQFVSFCGVTPLQHALADFMAAHPEHLDELPHFYQAKRDLFCQLIGPSPLRHVPTPGTYFQLADYRAIRDDLDDVAMAEWLTREAGVAAIPISVFYREPPKGLRLVRFCFAKQDQTLQQAAERLCAL
ncbi:methionine aminotransferase [Alcanivorax sp. S71-1-4]|uniref:pyridoxal phosphate-dependent aminotransferase n=1 Tax=Alcanivorax sp. S71-1-4 TaxID=1177159 RepID=UPI0013576F35|nr:pyridoxal phosphate-dependent aminotransferase [Alcanivorax sp. S71-1-4]KAF0805978.1 methionine aminotransferase [Alcanivorax sp. S71-1-4]